MQMGSGVLLMTAAGISWLILAVIISSISKKGLDIAFVQGMSALLIIAITIPLGIDCAGDVPKLSIVSLLLAGIFNYLVFLLMDKAMKHGPHGIIWAMSQSAFVIPFLMGIIFFATPPTPLRLAGIFTLITATITMGFVKDNTGKSGEFIWIFFAITAYFTAGLTQCCTNLPSYFIAESGSSTSLVFFRTGLFSCGTLAAYLCHWMIIRNEVDLKKSVRSILLMTAASVAASFLVYAGLDKLSASGVGAIGYPLTSGISIASFQVYTAISLKEKTTWKVVLGIMLCISGSILLAL